jgi:hypothetical protein
MYRTYLFHAKELPFPQNLCPRHFPFASVSSKKNERAKASAEKWVHSTAELEVITA